MLSNRVNEGTDIVQLAVYGALTLPAFYCLFRHGRRGILGWVYVIIYCTIRLVAAGLSLKNTLDHTTSTAALVVDNIGLSPLLLAAAGILHESRDLRHSIKNNKIEWLIVLQYHMLVSAALALIAVSVVKLTGSNPSASDMKDLKAGFAVFFVAWVLLALMTVASLRVPGPYTTLKGDESFRNGTVLLNAVLFSLPMTLLRAIYGAIDLFGSGSASSIGTSSFASNVAGDVCMNVLPPMLASIVFVAVGLLTVRR